MVAPAMLSGQERPTSVPPGSISIRTEGRTLLLSPAACSCGICSGWPGFPSEKASGRQRAVIYVKLTGADGQSAVVALVDVDPTFSKRVVLVADRRDGKPLDAAEGPWRVFIHEDLRHARWIRGLVSIEALTLK